MKKNLLRDAEEALWQKLESESMDPDRFMSELDALQRDVPVSEGEIEDRNRYAWKRQIVFRETAYAVAAALANIPAVRKVMLFGSVAAPLQKEVPRFRRLRRARIQVLHECKDVDLAVWLSDFTDLRGIKKAIAHALNEWHRAHPNGPGVAHHQVDTFLFDASSDKFCGNLCHYGECPKGKPECATPGCGAAAFVQVRQGLKLRDDALVGGRLLFDRETGFLQLAEQEASS